MLPFFTTLILDKNNNLKLIRLNYKGKIQIVPMPFELAPKDLEGIDFKTLSEYKISRTSRLYEAYYEE